MKRRSFLSTLAIATISTHPLQVFADQSQAAPHGWLAIWYQVEHASPKRYAMSQLSSANSKVDIDILIQEDFMAGNTIELDGFTLSKLEAAILIAHKLS